MFSAAGKKICIWHTKRQIVLPNWLRVCSHQNPTDNFTDTQGKKPMQNNGSLIV